MQTNKILKYNTDKEKEDKTIHSIEESAHQNNFNQAIQLIYNHLNDQLSEKGESLEEKEKVILGNEFEIKKLQFKLTSLERDLAQRRNTQLDNLNLRHEISILEDEIRQINHQKVQDQITIENLKSQVDKLIKEKQFLIQKLQQTSKQLNLRTVKYLQEDRSEFIRLNEKVDDLKVKNLTRFTTQRGASGFNDQISPNGQTITSNIQSNQGTLQEINQTLDQVLLRIQTTSPFSEKFAGNLDILLDIYKQSRQTIDNSDRGISTVSHDQYERALDFCAVIKHGENIKFYLKGIAQNKNMKTFESSYNLLTAVKGFEENLLSSGALSNLLMIISMGSGIEARHRVLTLNLLKMIIQGNLDQQMFSFEIRKIDFLKIFLQQISAKDKNYEMLDCLIEIFIEMLNFEFFPLLQQFRGTSTSNTNNSSIGYPTMNGSNSNTISGNQNSNNGISQNLSRLIELLILFVRDHFSNSKFSRLAPRMLRILYLIIEQVNRQQIKVLMLQKNLHFELVHLVRDFVDDCEKNYQGRVTHILAFALAILTNFVDQSPAFVITVSAPFQRIRACSLLTAALDPQVSRQLNIQNLFACVWHICTKISQNSQLTQFRSTFMDAGMMDQIKTVFVNYDSPVFVSAFEIFKELIVSQYELKRESYNQLLNEFIISLTARYQKDIHDIKNTGITQNSIKNTNQGKGNNQSSVLNGVGGGGGDFFDTQKGTQNNARFLPILSIMRFLRDLLFNNPFTIPVYKNGNISDLFQLILGFQLNNMEHVENGVNQNLLVQTFYIILTLLEETEFRKVLVKKKVPIQILELLQVAFKQQTNDEFNSVIIESLPGLFDSDGSGVFKGFWEQNLDSLQFIRNLFMHYSDSLSSGTVCEPFTCTLNSISKIQTLRDNLFNSRLAVNRVLDYCYMHFVKATGEFKTMIVLFIKNLIFLRTDIVMIIVKENQNSMKIILFGIASENRVISILSAQILYEVFQVIESADFLNLNDLPVAESLRKLVINTNQSDTEKLQVIQDLRTIYKIKFGKIFLQEGL